MKLSPLDIEHQNFDGALNGFKKRQVREFLAHVAEAFEEALHEIQRLREEIGKRDRKIEELQVAEVELKRAVIAAERIGNELKQNARREAELIVQEAEAAKAKLTRDTELKLDQAKAELARLEREKRLFREQFRGLLNAYERSLEDLAEEDGSTPPQASILLDE